MKKCPKEFPNCTDLSRKDLDYLVACGDELNINYGPELGKYILFELINSDKFVRRFRVLEKGLNKRDFKLIQKAD